LIAILILFAAGCKHTVKTPVPKNSLERILERDTLNAIVLYGSSSYFIYKDEVMGYDYDLCSNLADSLGVHLNLIVAKSVNDAIRLLSEGKGDMIAAPVDLTRERKACLNYTNVDELTTQVLVQPSGKDVINDVTGLIGQTVCVQSGTRYATRLYNLNHELGNKINIREVGDTVSMDELIEMVAAGKIRFTVTSNEIGELSQNNISGVDVHLPISFQQRSSWVTLKRDKVLCARINQWYSSAVDLGTVAQIKSKYTFENKFFADKLVKIPRGAISPYDNLFKRYAKQLGWRWQMLAAQAYHESRFDASCVAWSGASGLMQLMPVTAGRYGLDQSEIFNPERNIEAAVQYIKMLNMMFHEIENKEERVKFILASYHSGPGHVLDAMALAGKYGKNPHLWESNVEDFLHLKSQSQYYNDPVCRNGFFNAAQTIRYVHDVIGKCDGYMKRR
jgi:membrane-bound lytic murein transglycosylase F